MKLRIATLGTVVLAIALLRPLEARSQIESPSGVRTRFPGVAILAESRESVYLDDQTDPSVAAAIVGAFPDLEVYVGRLKYPTGQPSPIFRCTTPRPVASWRRSASWKPSGEREVVIRVQHRSSAPITGVVDSRLLDQDGRVVAEAFGASAAVPIPLSVRKGIMEFFVAVPTTPCVAASGFRLQDGRYRLLAIVHLASSSSFGTVVNVTLANGRIVASSK